jgi:intracellular multiplication protein IcmL
MAEEDLQLVSLRDDFYRDGFYKALGTFAILLIAIILLSAASLYLKFSKPSPVEFLTGDEFRTVAPVPVNLPYLKQPDLVQWISERLPALFRYDFIDYNKDLNANIQYFTENGWKNYQDLLKIYADGNSIATSKLFVNAVPGGAPIILNQGLLPGGVYGWWIQMPLNLSYSSRTTGNAIPLMAQVLIVRVPTLNNLMGVAIEKMTMTKKGGGNQIITNG